MCSRTPSGLTSRILEVIRAAEKRGDVPSVRGLQAVVEASSTSVVMYHLRRLAEDGDLEFGTRGAARSYRLTAQGRGMPSDEELLRECRRVLELYVVNDLPILDRLQERLG